MVRLGVLTLRPSVQCQKPYANAIKSLATIKHTFTRWNHFIFSIKLTLDHMLSIFCKRQLGKVQYHTTKLIPLKPLEFTAI